LAGQREPGCGRQTESQELEQLPMRRIRDSPERCVPVNL